VKVEGGLIYGNKSYSPLDPQMQLTIDAASGIPSQIALVIEIPSFEAGLVAFLFVFLLMGIMYYVLRTDKNKTMPSLNPVGPREIVKLRNPLSTSDAPYIAVITLVVLELVLDALIVVSALQGMGSIGVGTMLALASFLLAAILAVYRSTYMTESFMRKPRLETVAASLFEESNESEQHA